MITATLSIVGSSLSVFSFSQEPSRNERANVRNAPSAPKAELMRALELSKRAKSVRRQVDGTVRGRQLNSVFEYVAPDRFYIRESLEGAPAQREAIEIGRQRYQKQKKGDEWVKVLEDPAPLREQFATSFFPLKFVSARDDAIKIASVTVSSLGGLDDKGVKYGRYRYSVVYSGVSIVDSGVAWVNRNTGHLELIDYDGVGLAGEFKSKWKFDYGKEIVIEAPKAFVVKNWID